MFGMLNQFEREIWDVVIRWQKLYDRGSMG
jgi:hypothetical protein